MVRVFAADLKVQRSPQRLGQRPEEMRHEFGGQFTHALTVEIALPDKKGPAAQVQGNLRLRLVHGQQKAVTRDAALVAQRLTQRGSQRQRTVLDRMMLVDAQVAAALEVQRKAAVLGDLFEHVVEKADARADAAG